MSFSHPTGGLFKTDALIIGGGLAGLTCAVGLRQSGLKMIVLESSDSLGGRARSWIDAKTGDPIDIGPHIFLSEYPNMLKLLKILGTRDRIVWHTDPFITMVRGRSRVVMRMAPLPPPFHFVPSVIADQTISAWDKISNLKVTLFAMRMDETDVLKLDRVAALDFLRRMGVTERYIEQFWAFASISIMNVPVEKCSAGALMRFYRHLIGHNNYHIGFPSAGLGDMFVPQARALLEASGVQFLLKTGIKGFIGDAHSATGVELDDGRRIEARFLISTLPPQTLRRMAHGEWLRHHKVFQDLDSFHPSPYISSYIWFERKLTREQFWAQLYSARNLNCDFYDLSNINRGWESRPSIIASNIIYSRRAAHMSDEEIIRFTIRELAEHLPSAARVKVLHSVVNRIPMAISCPYPGVEQKRPATRSPVRSLFLAGDWTRTGIPFSMESAVRSGWLAAEQVLTEIGLPRSLALKIKETEGFSGLMRRLAKKFKV
jgi:15-cis-phytoene desaturase